MQKLNHPVEKLVETFLYKGVEFEVVERPEVALITQAITRMNPISEQRWSAIKS